MAQQRILSGNEAVAWGAIKGGVHCAAAYPGLPSTEILLTIARNSTIHAEWSVNEKVAADLCLAASICGMPSICAMKDLGFNVASETFLHGFDAPLKAGMVIVSCDDAGRLIGDDMNDTRRLAKALDLPVLEPSSPQEAYAYTRLALELSKAVGKPVVLRLTAILTHGTGVVDLDQVGSTGSIPTGPSSTLARTCREAALPVHLYRHENWSDGIRAPLGFIGSGMAMAHLRQAFPQAPAMVLALSWPLDLAPIRHYASHFERLVVLEESHPILEQELQAAGISCEGQSLFPRGTTPFFLSPSRIRRAFTPEAPLPESIGPLPTQLPVNCPGCPHRHLFFTLGSFPNPIAGDSGCYAVNGFPPASRIQAFLCMGAGTAIASGCNASSQHPDPDTTMISVLGDGVFFHSGMSAILDMYRRRNPGLVIIADNGTIAMTGGQGTPASGVDSRGRPVPGVMGIEDMLHSMGIDHVPVIDPYHRDELHTAIKHALSLRRPSVIISRHPCLVSSRKERPAPLRVGKDCINCGTCLRAGCTALATDHDAPSPRPRIDPGLCVSCGLCASLCPKGCIGTGQKESCNV